MAFGIASSRAAGPRWSTFTARLSS
jgi:hypothetical protein